jgi:hypothetical protein
MGGWTGDRLGAPSITAESPGCIVHLLGWTLLLVPIIVFLVRKYLICKTCHQARRMQPG